MRNYWLKICLGMLGVFAAGMLVITIVRAASGGVRHVVESDRPITIPLGFVPFKLDGEKLGTIERVVLVRSAPKQVSGVEVVVELADSALADTRLAGCALALDDLDRLDDRTTFRCVRDATDSAGQDLEPFGEIQLDNGDAQFVLLLPRDAVREFKQRDGGERLADSLRILDDSLREWADSIAEAASAQADSIIEAGSLRADSIREAAREHADSIRNARRRR